MILGIFYGTLYWIYLQLTPGRSDTNRQNEALLDRELYEELLGYRSDALLQFESSKTQNYPPSQSGDEEVEQSISRLEKKDVLAFIAQSYLSHSILLDDTSQEQIKGMKPYHVFRLAELLLSDEDPASTPTLTAYLIRDVKLINSSLESEVWELMSGHDFGSSFTNEDLAIIVERSNPTFSYDYLKADGVINSDGQFSPNDLSLTLAFNCLDNMLTDTTQFEQVFKSLYTSLLDQVSAQRERSNVFSYLFSKMVEPHPSWLEDYFVAITELLSDDDITTFLNSTQYVDHHWGGIYTSFDSDFFQALPHNCRIAMINVLEQGFVGFFEAQVIEDLKNSGYTETASESTISFYTEKIKSDPNDPYNYIERGKILANDFQDYNRALEDFTTAIDIDNSMTEAFFQRGLIMEKLNDISGSIADYDRVIELDPENTYAFGNRGIMKHQIGDYLGAIDDYTMTLKIDSTYVDAYYGRGLSKSILGDTLGALEDYGSAINIDPRYLDAYINKSLLNIELGNLGSAIKDYKLVLEYDRNNLDALYGLAFSYYQTDSLDLSRNYYANVVELYPEETDAYYSLGLICNKQGGYQKAYSYFTKTIFMDSAYTDALVQRGLSSVNQNDTINACLDWVKALQRNEQDAQYYLDIYCRN